jgi:DNA-binding transcriptional LysR family regulator
MSLLENIRVFVRVVEQDSMSAAGRLLRLSPAVVSHRIQSLESHLGVRLLNRTTRRVQPTEQGLAFYQAAQEVMAAVERAETVVAGAGGQPQGALRITAPLGFARRVLAPLVPEFQQAHPKVTLQLRCSEHLIDLLNESVDVALRMGILTDSSLIARKIVDCERLLCAAPAYLSAEGTPAARSRFAAVPLDAADGGRSADAFGAGQLRCRRRRPADRLGAGRPGHRAEAAVGGGGVHQGRPVATRAAGLSA